ncbi:MAG TPA: tripartite tricarboxylate transporter substrate binding protein [Burkholderiaceae bacterium]|jgi:tripartite-type tricarboxylate transporter receptor subunit TctC|nr:tripartite tricarboxylate transporter substrate binding protein [Burkholderiaceae bacterium]
MNRFRRGLLAAISVGLIVPATALAQTSSYPNKPIRIIVPFAIGGIADTFGRVIGIKLTEAWGQPVIIENKTGAGGNIGAEVVAKSSPDGYTLVIGNNGTHAVNVNLFKTIPFDPIKDFVPIAHIVEAEGLLVVNPSVKATSVREIVELARAQPGQLSYASGGLGTTSHLAGELFKSTAKVDIVHVPYKGNSPAIADLLGGQTQLSFATMPTVLPHVKAGKLRAIASIGLARTVALPDVPTVAESGLPGFEVSNWIGLFAPAGTAPDIVAKLNAEVQKIMRSPDVQKRLEAEGARFIPMTPGQFASFQREELTKWAKIIKDAAIKAE